ncbi:TonB-dependent receptor [Sphingomonas sp. MG17]|uniref:TonB-dependent receptor n=1 Tax=Sphingomonas tagetis TaxID=2949092 RepID=A0A9X2KMI4_9SPHN|nr:TonB-dependent receptor [Sphingomonas tagetis]MCP3731516.1 TonB-dependent receptor [Sphingomonas tagetis]
MNPLDISSTAGTGTAENWPGMKRRYSLALIAAIPADECWAQTSAAKDGKSEIVVTGERADRTVLETTSSVSVFGADQIIQLAAADRIEQLLASIPNIQVGSGGDGPTIRGQDSTGVLRDLPAFLGGNRPRVTLQVDGRAVGYNEFAFGAAPLWDIEQVEVFRNPQTTTQGRNSIAGAIFVTSKDPSYGWEVGTRLIVGNYATRQASAAVSGPIVEEQLAFRLAGDVRSNRVSSQLGGSMVGADPNRDDYALVRAKLLAEPAAFSGVRIEVIYSHSRSQAPQIVSVREPFRQRRDPLASFGVFRISVDSLTASLDYRFSERLSSTTTVSFGGATIRRFAPAGLGQARLRGHDRSIESILRWQHSDALKLLGGVSVVRADLAQSIDLSAVVLGEGDFKDSQSSAGVFGEIVFDPMPRLTVSLGLRYQSDSQSREGSLGRFQTDYDERFSAWLPKMSLAYEIGKSAIAGVMVQRAYNPGGTTINLDTGGPENFDAETLWNYEGFLRAPFKHGALTANFFYTNMRSAQRAQQRTFRAPGGPAAFWALIDNVPAAESYGAEAELFWRATSRLSLRAGVGVLGTRILRTLDPADPILSKHFQRSPALTGFAALDWRPVNALRLSLQSRSNSGYFSDDANTAARRIRSATITDARMGYTSGPFTISGYARNLFDTFYLTFLNSGVVGVAGDPREVGLSLEARF